MSRSDWQQVEEIFHAVVELEAASRGPYLDAACRGDRELRREVESLVAAFEGERGFMEQPVMSLGMRVMVGDEDAPRAGQSVGRYKIVRALGRGGMGEVYLAEDESLERNVALKFIAGAFPGGGWAKEQLTREARAVAKLEHPNICAVHGIEEVEGHSFIVMQYVEGETLASELQAGRVPTERALDLAEQIASGLAAAHARGVVHRDIKPQNVIITGEGQAKVLDFGLAKLVRPVHAPEALAAAAASGAAGDRTLHAGLVVGTVAYMSPEQTRAEELDECTDVFSLGVVLYEMFAGSHPFMRETQAGTVAAIEREEPPPFDAPACVSEGLNRLVRRCLAKDRRERYPSAEDLLGELRALRGRYEKAHAPSATRLYLDRLRRYAYPALALLLVLAAAAAYAYHGATRVRTLAILPFANATGNAGLDYVGEGLTQSLADRLSQVSTLRVKAPTLARPGEARGLGPLAAGREARAEAVLFGEMTTEGEAPRLRARLLSTSDGSTLWEQSFDVTPEEVRSLRDRIARGATEGLGLWLSAGERGALTKQQTDSPEAQKLHMMGQYYWNRRNQSNIRKAIEMFERAADADPTYAQAYAGLANSYVFRTTVAYGAEPTGEMIAKARWAAKKAVEADPMLSEAHVALGVIRMRLDWDWEGAEREFRRAVELQPESAPAHLWYSQLLMLLGRNGEALRESEAAREFDPFSPSATLNAGRAHYYARRPDDAARFYKELLVKNPEDRNALYMLGLAHVQKGAYREAVEILSRLYAADPLYAAAPLGYAYAKWGRRDEALRVLDRLDEISREKDENGRERKVPPQERAIIYVGLGDRDRAFAHLEEAYRDRFFPLSSINAESIFDDLRGDPRFADLVRRMNLSP
jgi:eukaryotic-like serine/threonine-protein kinase